MTVSKSGNLWNSDLTGRSYGTDMLAMLDEKAYKMREGAAKEAQLKAQKKAQEDAAKKAKSDAAWERARTAQAQNLARNQQEKALAALNQYSQPAATTSANTTTTPANYSYNTGQTSTSGTSTGANQSTSNNALMPTTIQTPYGTLKYENGNWVYAESDAVSQQRGAYEQWQKDIMGQIQGVGNQDAYRQSFIQQNLPEAERQYAQSMAGRGLLNSDAYGKGLGTITSNITTQAGLNAEQQRQSVINNLLSQMQTGQQGGTQYQSQPQNAVNLGLNALGQYQNYQQNQQQMNNNLAFNYAQLGQQNNQFQQELSQRQTESARNYGINQANLLSSIFGSGGIF